MDKPSALDVLKVRTVPALLAYSAQAHGTTLALKMRSGLRLEKYTYAELVEQVGRMAGLLLERGLGRGERVLLWAPNSPAWVIAFLGIHQIGAVAVPLDVRSTPEFVQKVIQQTEPRLAIVGQAMGGSLTPFAIPHLTTSDMPLQLRRQVASMTDSTVQSDDLAEIMYTSGTTGIPKGAMLTHRNLVSNVEMALAVMPVGIGFRVLSVLPLSHMFEQIVGLLVPLASGASIVYVPSRRPNVLLQSLRHEQITAMALVPQALSLIMRNIEREIDQKGLRRVWKMVHALAPRLPMTVCRLLFWPVHRSLGGHLEFLVSGGATLPPEVGQKWENLGIPVLEGYGGTEATAIVSANLPRQHRLHTVGRPVPGVELQIVADGEIVVRGENIFQGYWRNPQATREVLTDGWYHTGDLGELDAEGFLHFRGRKKNLIALADGMKVHAEDVEAALQGRAGIRDVIVVGLPKGERVEVHAVVLSSSHDEQALSEAVRAANDQLAPHQHIKGFTIWDGDDFPNTPTLKVKRYEVLRQLTDGVPPVSESLAATPVVTSPNVRALLAQQLGIAVESILPTHELVRDLGLDSLSSIELLLLVEEQLGVQLAEPQLPARATVADLEAMVNRHDAATARVEVQFPCWPLHPLVVGLRALLQTFVFHPLLAMFVQLRLHGRENLDALERPCLLIGNHTSHLDTLVMTRILPRAIRQRVAVAAAADYWFHNSLQGFLACLAYNLYPMVRNGSARPSLEHTVELIDRGWSVLIFPEGTRSPNGQLQPFRAGIGLLASETGIPVVPIRLRGAYDILPKGQWWPRRGAVTVTVGAPLCFPLGSDAVAVTHELEDRLRTL